MSKPNNRTKRMYIISRLLYSVFQIIDNRDTIQLIRLYDSVYKTLLIFKAKAPVEEKELIAIAKDIWVCSGEVSKYKISNDALNVMLEYLSSIVSEHDYKTYFSTKNYLEEFKDVPNKDKLELVKITLYIQERLYELYKIKLPTCQFVTNKKTKTKRVRDKKQVKEIKSKNKNVKKFLRKKEIKKKLQLMVKNAKLKKELQLKEMRDEEKKE